MPKKESFDPLEIPYMEKKGAEEARETAKGRSKKYLKEIAAEKKTKEEEEEFDAAIGTKVAEHGGETEAGLNPLEMPYMEKKGAEEARETAKGRSKKYLKEIAAEKKAKEEEEEFDAAIGKKVSKYREMKAHEKNVVAPLRRKILGKQNIDDKWEEAIKDAEAKLEAENLRKSIGGDLAEALDELRKGEKESMEAGKKEAARHRGKKQRTETEAALKDLQLREDHKKSRAKLKPRKGTDIDSKFDFGGPPEIESEEFEIAPFSDLEEKFFKEEEERRGKSQESRKITNSERADAFRAALAKMPEKELEKIGYGVEAADLKSVIKDIDARHKSAPESFPYTGAEVVKKFNEMKYMQAEIGHAAEAISQLMRQAGERKKKSGFFGRFFGRKRSFLEPDELEQIQKLEADYRGALKYYKTARAEYEKIFHPLRDLAEKGNAKTIAFRGLPETKSFPRI